MDRVDPSNAARAAQRYLSLTQGKRESLSEFKARHDTLLHAMEALDLDLPTETQQASQIVTKVNSKYETAAKKIDDAYRMQGTQVHPTRLSDY